MDELRSLLSTNQSDRLKREKAALDRIDDPKLPRHTVYQGDRKIQQLGQDAIENGVIINNQSVAIGEVMLPLAKGNVLRRVDKTNGGALLGTAYRDALENDFDANGNLRTSPLSRNGGNEPSDPNNPNRPRKPSDRVPPPFGCNPPSKDCFWSSNPSPPQGFQNYGDAVVNENGDATYLHCKAGSSVPANLGCDFLNPPPVTTYSCSGGVCSPDPNGNYPSLEACQAALIPPPFTGGQCTGGYKLQIGVIYQTGGILGYYVAQNSSPVEYTEAEVLALGTTFDSPISSLDFRPQTEGSLTWVLYVSGEATNISASNDGSNLVVGYELITLIRADGSPDNCGDLPPTCPT